MKKKKFWQVKVKAKDTHAMRMDNGCYTAELVEQLRPQQLDTNVFFGPLNALTQRDFLEQHNIRFFIGVGIDTARLSSLVQGTQVLENDGPFPSLMINFDERFDHGTLAASAEITQLYHFHHTKTLSQLAAHSAHVLQKDAACYMQSNVFSETGIERFQTFSDLVVIFKMAAHLGNILVFSQNGNDEQLLMLLIFIVLQKYPYAEPSEAAKFIKCLRPTVQDLTAEQLYWCVKAKESFGGPQLHLPSEHAKPVRKCSDECGPQNTTIRFHSTKRSRLNQ